MPGRHGIRAMGWQGRLKGCGYRITLPRRAILNVLSKTCRHLSAEEIYLEVHKRYPAVGLTTVYRTLDLLVGVGMVFKFDFGDRRARYELSEGADGLNHHHHLICTICGRITDYTDFINEEIELLEQTEKGLAKKYNYKITKHLIQFYGVCDMCQKGK